MVGPGFVDAYAHGRPGFWILGFARVTTALPAWLWVTVVLPTPCKQDADLVFRNLERAEDLSRDAMLEGIDWTWETFPQFLDAVDALPKGINYEGYIGHSALHTYVMGERAFSETATEDDTRRMQAVVQEAMHAGAVDFTHAPSITLRQMTGGQPFG